VPTMSLDKPLDDLRERLHDPVREVGVRAFAARLGAWADRRPLGLRAFAHEAGIAVLVGFVYFLIRGSVVDRVDEATSRAVGLMNLERSLGLFWEPAMQGWILSSRFLIDLFNGIYFWSHMPIIVGVAVVLFWRRHDVYVLVRNAFVVSAVVALVMYFLLPVTPPRLLPDGDFVDTMALYATANYQAQEVGPFVNPYAALPSLHFGWALLIGIALWFGRPASSWLRYPIVGLALLLPLGQFFAIVMTGNHYVLDAAAGAIVAGVGLAVACWWRQSGMRALPRRWPRARRTQRSD
jgi:hypothetical protein